jgi:hypothetical protein
MPPPNNNFGGGTAETVLGTGVVALMILAVLLVFLLPRRWVLVPLMFAIFLLPTQSFVIGGFHLFVSRILILAGLGRSIASRSHDSPLFGGGYNAVDTLFILYAIFHVSAFVLLYQQLGALANQFGFLWDLLGGYLLMRFLIRDDDDIQRTIKIFSVVATVLAATLLYEKFYDVNLYGFIAGHPIIPEIRNGSIRAQGPFHHAILAGTFGATLLPLFFWLWKSGKSKVLGLIGMFASSATTLASASSTPASAYLAAILAICFWPIRGRMRMVRWGIVIAILALNMVMRAPVWWALEHVDLAGGSAGEHRAELVDNFIRHFGDWWLIGTKDNANWGFEMWDQSNQYIADGETGGLATFICLIGVISVSFRRLGLSRRFLQGDATGEWYIWLLGAALFSHCVAFLGISYFDQTRVTWYALLAMISVATAPLLKARGLSPERHVETLSAKPHMGYSPPWQSAKAGSKGSFDSQRKPFNSGLVQHRPK